MVQLEEAEYKINRLLIFTFKMIETKRNLSPAKAIAQVPYLFKYAAGRDEVPQGPIGEL